MRSIRLQCVAVIAAMITWLGLSQTAFAGAVAAMAGPNVQAAQSKSVVLVRRGRRPGVRRRAGRRVYRRRRRGVRIYIGPGYYSPYYRPYYRVSYCRVVRRRCAYRYGWRTRRWYRCVRSRRC